MSHHECQPSDCDSTVDVIAVVASILIVVGAAVYWVATR